MKKEISLISLLTVIFSICTFFFGMYYTFCHFATIAVLGGVLLRFLIRNKKLNFELTMGMLLFFVLLFGFVISLIPAVDCGVAFLEIGRIVWPGMFLILYQQTGEKAGEKLFNVIPWIGVAETLFGIAVYFIPSVKKYFWPDDRLGGFFQYPNTFALFLLIGIIIILHKKQSKIDFIAFIILMIGIAASGSRTILIMTVPVVLIIAIYTRQRTIIGTTILLIITGAVFVLVTGNTATLGRLLKISLSSSALNGRLLYAHDAIPVILKHPFGVGASGFYYLQNEVQPGLYYVRYIHNDLLQIGLDIGWFPMLFYLYACIRSVIGKNLNNTQKWVLVVIFLHGLLDFDQAYGVITCLLLVIMNDQKLLMKTVSKEKKRTPALTHKILAGICMVFGIYLFIPTFAGYCNNPGFLLRFYPYDTEAKLQLLSQTTDFSEAEELADSILAQNKTCSLAHYTKAYIHYCNSQYHEMIISQRKAIRYSYLDKTYYLQYIELLYNSLMICDSPQLLNECRLELVSIPQMMEQAKDRLSTFGLSIVEQPDLDLEEELLSLIAELK